MNKKIKLLITLCALALFCLFLVSCSANDKPPYEKYDEAGYTVSVKYDANGGYLKNPGETFFTDTYNFSKLSINENGKKEVYLVDPSSELRDKVNRYDDMKFDNLGYLLVGWYEERTPVLENGKQKKDDKGYPMYTYSKKWDFSKPLLIENEDKYTSAEPVITLYAAWIRTPTVEIYENIDGVETLISVYEIPSATTEGQNVLTMPYIKLNNKGKHELVFGTLDGAKIFNLSEDANVNEDNEKNEGEIDNAAYNWLAKERILGYDEANNVISTTFFNGFYADKSRTEILNGTILHPYQYDPETVTISNPTMKLYVDFETKEGEWHKIYSAEEFCNEGNVLGRDFKYTNANLEIMSDLVFTDLKWPTITSFDGKIIGNGHKIIDACVANTNGTKAALFREIGKDAVIKDITFENASVTVKSPSAKGGARYALFATSIESGFAFENVSIVNSKILISARTEINSNILNGDYEVALLCAEGYHDGLNIDISGISFEPYVSESDLFELSATLDADGNKLNLVFTVKEQDSE